MSEKTWRLGLEGNGHLASEVRKQREMNAGAQLILFSVFSPGFQSIEWCYPQPQWVFSPQLSISRNKLIDTLINVFPW